MIHAGGRKRVQCSQSSSRHGGQDAAGKQEEVRYTVEVHRLCLIPVLIDGQGGFFLRKSLRCQKRPQRTQSVTAGGCSRGRGTGKGVQKGREQTPSVRLRSNGGPDRVQDRLRHSGSCGFGAVQQFFQQTFPGGAFPEDPARGFRYVPEQPLQFRGKVTGHETGGARIVRCGPYSVFHQGPGALLQLFQNGSTGGDHVHRDPAAQKRTKGAAVRGSGGGQSIHRTG